MCCPALQTSLRDEAFETCTRMFWPPHPESSLLHPCLLPFLFPEWHFFPTFVFPALVASSQYWSVWCWQWSLLMIFFPLQLPAMGMKMAPSQFKHTKGWAVVNTVWNVASARPCITPGSHSYVVTGHIRATRKYIQIAATETASQSPHSAPSDAPLTWWMEGLQVSDTGLKQKSAGVEKRWEALSNAHITSKPSLFSPFSAQPWITCLGSWQQTPPAMSSTGLKKGWDICINISFYTSNKVQGKKNNSTEKQAGRESGCGCCRSRGIFQEHVAPLLLWLTLPYFYKSFSGALCQKQRNSPGWRMLRSTSSLVGNLLESREGQSTSDPSDGITEQSEMRSLLWHSVVSQNAQASECKFCRFLSPTHNFEENGVWVRQKWCFLCECVSAISWVEGEILILEVQRVVRTLFAV